MGVRKWLSLPPQALAGLPKEEDVLFFCYRQRRQDEKVEAVREELTEGALRSRVTRFSGMSPDGDAPR